MNLNDIGIEILIIFPLLMILVAVTNGIRTLVNINKVKKIQKIIIIENLETIKTTQAYHSSIGLRKDYPSYPAVFNLSANSEEIFIYGYSKFPFIFRTYYCPFVLSTNKNMTQKKLGINQIFEPKIIKIKNKRHLNIQFINTNTIPTFIDYQIDFGNHMTEMILKNLKGIEDKIKKDAN